MDLQKNKPSTSGGSSFNTTSSSNNIPVSIAPNPSQAFYTPPVQKSPAPMASQTPTSGADAQVKTNDNVCEEKLQVHSYLSFMLNCLYSNIMN